MLSNFGLVRVCARQTIVQIVVLKKAK